MEEEYIDIAGTKEQYERALVGLKKDPHISEHNKELLLRFLRDAALGKTVVNKAKKKISISRCTGYIHQLYPLLLFTRKSLDQLTQQDMEAFIEALEMDKILSRRRTFRGTIQKPLSPRYKVDIKVSIRKFYKWLWGDNRRYPELVEWFDTYVETKEIQALTEAEVERMIDKSRNPLQRALTQVLFDGGFRIGELLNVRLRHVSIKAFDLSDPTKKCFFVRVPFSKTLRRTVTLPMSATTKYLLLWLEEHPSKPCVSADGTIEATNVNSQLFPMDEDKAEGVVKRLGQKALGKNVYPHLLRHTSATFWANKLPYFKFCKRFGWTMTSKMPQRYIDRAGVDEIEVANIYHNDERARLAREKQDLLAELAELAELKARVGEATSPGRDH